MNTKKAIFYTLAIILAGCVPSLQPLYTENDLIFEPKLIGTWASEDPEWKWCFEQAPTQADEKQYYILTVTDKQGSGRFDAHLLKLDNMMFLDLYPKDPNIKSCDLTKAHLVPAHTFYKVEQIDPNLQLKTLSPDDTKKFLEKDPNALKHELSNKNLVLTAQTKDLQNFVKNNINNTDIFKDFTMLKRVVPYQEPNTQEPNSIIKNIPIEKVL